MKTRREKLGFEQRCVMTWNTKQMHVYMCDDAAKTLFFCKM